MSAISIVDGRPEHLSGIAEIYAAAVQAGPATFDLEAPSQAWWRGVLDATDEAAGHMLVTAVDEAGAILGYAKSGPFRPKAAYASTCETSVYVAPSAHGRGVGRALYAELLGRLDRSGLRLAVAGVTDPNPASAQLHRSHGFVPVGTFSGVGVKFGQPWDVTWYQRALRGAVLLDELRAAVGAAASRADAVPGVAAVLGQAGHGDVRLFDAEDGALRPVGEVDAPPPAVDPAALAPGRPVLLANGNAGARALAPVLEPGSGVLLGALGSESTYTRGFDRIDVGLLSRCAETLLPLWGHAFELPSTD